MAKRFIVDKKDISFLSDEQIEISGLEIKHMHVLRIKELDEIIVNEYNCKVNKISKEKIILDILKKANDVGIPKVKLDLYQAMLKSDKFEFVIQKQVELGINKITPFFSKNVVVKLDEKSKQTKLTRYNKISLEACKQCGRSDLVLVDNFKTLDELVNTFKNYDYVILAYEKYNKNFKEVLNNIKVDLNSQKNVAVIVGAEGGFLESEVNKLEQMDNVHIVGLGERILRAETASIYLTSILNYELEI